MNCERPDRHGAGPPLSAPDIGGRVLSWSVSTNLAILRNLEKCWEIMSGISSGFRLLPGETRIGCSLRVSTRPG